MCRHPHTKRQLIINNFKTQLGTLNTKIRRSLLSVKIKKNAKITKIRECLRPGRAGGTGKNISASAR